PLLPHPSPPRRSPDLDWRTGRAFWIHATGQLRTAPVLVSGSPLPWEVTTGIAYADGFQVYSSDDTRRWRTADYSNEPMGDWEKVDRKSTRLNSSHVSI